MAPRAVCPRCERPARTCLCAMLPAPVAVHTQLLILQHPAEAGHAKNTTAFLTLGLSPAARLLRGEAFDAALAGPGAALLYPGEMKPLVQPHTAERGASDRSPEGMEMLAASSRKHLQAGRLGSGPALGPEYPVSCFASDVSAQRLTKVSRLILLDGTWRQSRKLLAANPWLAALPRLALPGRPSRYEIRRAHRPGQLSTLEAGLHALGLLEGAPERFDSLWTAFEGFVSRSLEQRGD